MGYNQLLTAMTIIFSCIILFISVAELRKKKYGLLIENIVSYGFYLAFLIAHYKLNLHVKIYIILLVLLTIIGNNLIGKYFQLYQRSKHYDRFLHAFGSFSFSLFFYSLLDEVTPHVVYPKFYVSLFVAAIGMSLGCIYEIYEFIADSMGNSRNQHGLKDTDFDLISDVIGAVLAGLAARIIFF